MVENLFCSTEHMAIALFKYFFIQNYTLKYISIDLNIFI